MTVEDSPLTSALNWEFNLWLESEKATFRASLQKLKAKREQLIKAQFMQYEEQKKKQSEGQRREAQDLQLEIENSISEAQQKLLLQQELQQSIDSQLKQVKTRLKQTLMKADADFQASLANANLQLQTETAKAEQFEAEAAFFEAQIAEFEQRRRQESQDFMEFLDKQKEQKKVEIAVLEGQKKEKMLRDKISETEGEIAALEWQLEEKMRGIQYLQQLVNDGN